jgi:hypothetical protein
MKIAMYDLEGHLLEVFEVNTIVELEKQLKIPQGNLNKVLKGGHNATNARQFREIMGNGPARKLIGNAVNASKKGQKYIPVIKYYKGNLITVYKSLEEASKKNIVGIEDISKCINGKRKTAGGFEWKYAN